MMATPPLGTLPALVIKSVEESKPARNDNRKADGTNISDGLRRQASILWRVWILAASVKSSHEKLKFQRRICRVAGMMGRVQL